MSYKKCGVTRVIPIFFPRVFDRLTMKNYNLVKSRIEGIVEENNRVTKRIT